MWIEGSVYVQNKEGKPLMPTKRYKKVKTLLKTNQAIIVSYVPFMIRLNYETPDITQPLYLGIDPGRTNIGLSVINESGEEKFTIQVETRNKDIPNLMKQRKQFRSQRRQQSRRTKRRRRARKNNTTKSSTFQRQLLGCDKLITLHDINNKESRFLNRKRSEGWLTPTANQLLQTHINLVKKIQRFLPITDIVVEQNKFSFMQLDNPNIKSYQYQRGKLYGYHGNLHQAVSTLQDHRCLLCGGSIDHYHHVIPRSQGGSDTIENIAGLCSTCHSKVHTNRSYNQKLLVLKEGIKKKYNALSILNQIIPYFISEMSILFPNHTYTVDGYSTKEYRNTYNIPKDHYLDAYCISSIIVGNQPKNLQELKVYQIKQFRRHDNQCCHQHNYDREYIYKGKVVACNRHKSLEQKTNSLEEYRELISDNPTIISNLIAEKGKPTYKDLNRIMPGSLLRFRRSKKVPYKYFTLKSNNGSYFMDFSGEKYNKKYCEPVLNNTGLVFIQ